MDAISEDAIRKRAYIIWEREGRPHGREFDHWVQAQIELAAEGTSGNGGKSIAPPAPAASKGQSRARSAPAPAGRAKKRA